MFDWLQCIDEAARQLGITSSLELPDKTLQFIRDRPLMDQEVQPINSRPLLVKKGAAFTSIVVTSVVALDGATYHVMFIGTGRIDIHILGMGIFII